MAGDALPLTIAELQELTLLELAERGETPADSHRKLRAKLERLRAGVQSAPEPVVRVKLGVAELKDEVRRLQERLRLVEEAIKDLNG